MLAPTNLSTTVDGASVMLTWEPGLSLGTEPPPASFNLRVGSTPGATDLVSPLAGPDGKRLVSGRGNAGSSLVMHYEFPLVDAGKYFWSVQAIDADGRGSAFAAEQTFELSAERPPLVRGLHARSFQQTAQIRARTLSMSAGTGYFEWGTTTEYGFQSPEFTLDGKDQWETYAVDLGNLIPGTRYHYRFVASNPSGKAFGGNRTFETSAFVPVENLAGVDYAAAAAADYDRDGDPDLVYSGVDASGVRFTKLMRNDGGWQFVDVPVNFTAVSHANLDWGDYDGDGDVDLLLTGMAGSLAEPRAVSEIYRNDTPPGGAARFTWLDDELIGITGGSAEWGDYDQDGDLDIVLAGRSQGGFALRLYRNAGRYFVDTKTVFDNVPEWPTGARLGDGDGDGDLDLLVTGVLDTSQEMDRRVSMFRLYRNDGRKSIFHSEERFVMMNRTGFGFDPTGIRFDLNSTAATADWLDYDADGDLDILTTSFWDSWPLLHQNDGNLEFPLNGNLTFLDDQIARAISAWADVDGDGDPDLLLSGTLNNVGRGSEAFDGPNVNSLYRNEGGGRFTLIEADLPGIEYHPAEGDVTGTGAVLWADFDSDGRPDLFMAGRNDEEGEIARFFRNGFPRIGESAVMNLTIDRAEAGPTTVTFAG
ncbi:MAG: VCBS repeat-containing protein, partial [Verrucomicrobiota bacterium]